MKAIIKSIFANCGAALCDCVPENLGNFHVLVNLTIGPDDQEGGDDYSLEVCTPVWLDHYIQNFGSRMGRHMLLVNEFDADKILALIERTIRRCERPDWAETSVVLSRYFAWEFEDYVAEPGWC